MCNGECETCEKKHVRNSVKKNKATCENYPRRTTNEIKAAL